MPLAIKAQNLSKAYQIGEIGTGTLSKDLERWFAKIRGKEDPFLKVGEVNDRSTKGTSNIVWSLKDINFEIQQGDAVGIIGRNGAGKSTLLKLLSRVTSPTTGEINVKGRIASLLEVGTGFHPELTGRENIYLNGAILGMRKKEIERKFDEIVDFSGVERYIDTPVKRYSSGMYVRLAFAVAAYLESEILIIDEVLAVGDAEFQKKCLGKMKDVSTGEGRTVLFVSHNMGSISQLCNTGIFLQNGVLETQNLIEPVINAYVNQLEATSHYIANNPRSMPYFKSIYFVKNSSISNNMFLYTDDIKIAFDISISNHIANLYVSFMVKDQFENTIFSSHKTLIDYPIKDSAIRLNAIIPNKTILPGNYVLSPILHIRNKEFVDKIDTNLFFTIEDNGSDHSLFHNADLGKLVVDVNWTS
jgi:lipopolysaccharide transport system ATP-binding protein